MGEILKRLNLNASGADCKKTIRLERMTDGDITIHCDQNGQPYRRTLSHVAQRVHVLHVIYNKRAIR